MRGNTESIVPENQELTGYVHRRKLIFFLYAWIFIFKIFTMHYVLWFFLQRVAPCQCLDGHAKELYEMSSWVFNHKSNFLVSPPAHLCVVTYIIKISLNVKLNNQSTPLHSTPAKLNQDGPAFCLTHERHHHFIVLAWLNNECPRIYHVMYLWEHNKSTANLRRQQNKQDISGEVKTIGNIIIFYMLGSGALHGCSRK